jgi:cadmium resistance protein CadD (predicted permease)
MMSTFNRSNGIFISSSIVIIIFMIAVFSSAQASQLRNIRIGEYPDHIRIVFEFNSPIKAEHILSKEMGQLTVVFEDSAVGLNRKIPIEKNRHIKDLQIWDQQTKLSTILMFDFKEFRLNSFQLTAPPRIAIDIFPNTDNRTISSKTISANRSIISQINKSRGTQNASIVNRFYFHLVIGLLTISIVILVLLLLLLIFRPRWLYDKNPLKDIESIKQQDEHIASIDAQIHEELKRYEKA